jgi:hypothetical protein
VQDVRYQVVAGANFLLTLNAQPFSDEIYVASIYQPLNGNPVINSLYKNGLDITNTIMIKPSGPYNYEADTNFKSLYMFFEQAVSNQTSILQPIYQVLYTSNPNRTYNYKVIYNFA